jgi:hypothetical protein
MLPGRQPKGVREALNVERPRHRERILVTSPLSRVVGDDAIAALVELPRESLIQLLDRLRLVVAAEEVQERARDCRRSRRRKSHGIRQAVQEGGGKEEQEVRGEVGGEEGSEESKKKRAERLGERSRTGDGGGGEGASTKREEEKGRERGGGDVWGKGT